MVNSAPTNSNQLNHHSVDWKMFTTISFNCANRSKKNILTSNLFIDPLIRCLLTPTLERIFIYYFCFCFLKMVMKDGYMLRKLRKESIIWEPRHKTRHLSTENWDGLGLENRSSKQQWKSDVKEAARTHSIILLQQDIVSCAKQVEHHSARLSLWGSCLWSRKAKGCATVKKKGKY